jgi:NAD(P)H-dependent flavin oxidoreductase YrpB (nitropropane dioxygenase family)
MASLRHGFERVPAVVFFWTPPPEEWVRRLKEAGCDVWLQTSSIAAARVAIASGVDIIIAQGSEAGGHNRSTTGLFPYTVAGKTQSRFRKADQRT